MSYIINFFINRLLVFQEKYIILFKHFTYSLDQIEIKMLHVQVNLIKVSTLNCSFYRLGKVIQVTKSYYRLLQYTCVRLLLESYYDWWGKFRLLQVTMSTSFTIDSQGYYLLLQVSIRYNSLLQVSLGIIFYFSFYVCYWLILCANGYNMLLRFLCNIMLNNESSKIF